jgi:hypothetical protein
MRKMDCGKGGSGVESRRRSQQDSLTKEAKKQLDSDINASTREVSTLEELL